MKLGEVKTHLARHRAERRKTWDAGAVTEQMALTNRA